MDSLKRKIQKYKKILLQKITFVIQIFGLLLIYLGEKIIGVKMKYRLVSSIIEGVFQSNDIVVRVEGITLHPLFVRFKLKVSVPKRYDIDGDYFRRELSQQLGCELSDINNVVENGNYFIDITNTALNNMEKGCTPYLPQAYERKNDSLIEEAKTIVLLHGEVSATLLQRKLKIGFARAARIMDELAEMDIVAPSPDSKNRKVIN